MARSVIAFVVETDDRTIESWSVLDHIEQLVTYDPGTLKYYILEIHKAADGKDS